MWFYKESLSDYGFEWLTVDVKVDCGYVAVEYIIEIHTLWNGVELEHVIFLNQLYMAP